MNTPSRIAVYPAKIRTGYIPDMSPESFCFSYPLVLCNKPLVMFKVVPKHEYNLKRVWRNQVPVTMEPLCGIFSFFWNRLTRKKLTTICVRHRWNMWLWSLWKENIQSINRTWCGARMTQTTVALPQDQLVTSSRRPCTYVGGGFVGSSLQATNTVTVSSSWRWKLHAPTKRWFPTTSLHGVTS
jgi:hypothetical protein